MKPTYEQLLARIVKGSVISFREYNLGRNEKKHLVFSIENTLVHDIIPANVALSRTILEEYYGQDLADQDYLQLSSINCARIVLFIENGENDKPRYKPLLFNKDYYLQGLQELEVINGMNEDEPNYLNSLYGTYERFEISADNFPRRVPIIIE
mgnify:CR=1 FL=1